MRHSQPGTLRNSQMHEPGAPCAGVSRFSLCSAKLTVLYKLQVCVQACYPTITLEISSSVNSINYKATRAMDCDPFVHCVHTWPLVYLIHRYSYVNRSTRVLCAYWCSNPFLSYVKGHVNPLRTFHIESQGDRNGNHCHLQKNFP